MNELTAFIDALLDQAFAAALITESQSMPEAAEVRKQTRIIQGQAELLLSLCRGLEARPGAGRGQYLENSVFRTMNQLSRSWTKLCDVAPFNVSGLVLEDLQTQALSDKQTSSLFDPRLAPNHDTHPRPPKADQ